MLDFLYSIISSKIFIANFIICWALLELAFYKIKPLYPVTEAHRARDKKFAAFQRMDLHQIKRMHHYPMMPFIFIKIIIAYTYILFLWSNFVVLSLFFDKGKPFSGMLKTYCTFITKVCAIITCAMGNGII